MTIHFHIGHNLSGYLPESDVFCSLAWDDAVATLEGEMTDYADTDDDAAYDSLSMVPASDYPAMPDGSPDYGDDAPMMRATVDAILADDGPQESDAGNGWSARVEDSNGRMITFWIAPVPASDCDRDDADDDETIAL